MLRIALAILLFVPFGVRAEEEEVAKTFGDHHGYLFDVKEERNRRDIEMVMLEKPKSTGKPLNEILFNEKLSKEFQTQYQYRFGQTQAEQVLNTPARSDEYTVYTGQNVTIQEYQKQQRGFGEYMVRRLAEFHVDNWAKSDPDFKPVYAAKERVSNLNMKVGRSYRVRWKYNLAGPSMEFKLENKFKVDVKVRVEMSGVLSAPDESIYTLGYQLTNRVYVSAIHREHDRFYQIAGTRQMTKNIGASLTASTDQSDQGASIKQDMILVGLSWWD